MSGTTLTDLDQIYKQYEKLLEETGVNLDFNEVSQLDELLGFSLEDLNNDIEEMFKTQYINFEKIHPDAILPKYAYSSDSGFDLHSVEKITLSPFGRAAVPTGLKVEFKEGFEIQIRPKSGLSLKLGITVLNTPGTIDQGYTGEIKVIIFNTNNHDVVIDKGMKIAQGVLSSVIPGRYVNINEVTSLDEKERGDNGFGSTGI